MKVWHSIFERHLTSLVVPPFCAGLLQWHRLCGNDLLPWRIARCHPENTSAQHIIHMYSMKATIQQRSGKPRHLILPDIARFKPSVTRCDAYRQERRLVKATAMRWLCIAFVTSARASIISSLLLYHRPMLGIGWLLRVTDLFQNRQLGKDLWAVLVHCISYSCIFQQFFQLAPARIGLGLRYLASQGLLKPDRVCDLGHEIWESHAGQWALYGRESHADEGLTLLLTP